ncbi:glycine-rich cell wall structural protein 1-like [Cynara cardunculus var. scolymus]|uniref:glycine-rich cell wall structural protein 1-like n=1 Tax=Cynara cardunculus var. scolymus TaxID=59895 RepID=UPI000D625980|nr:glycine-rich cell wall structural protein 1-like [Cynara cardunculus var. scolymus]
MRLVDGGCNVIEGWLVVVAISDVQSGRGGGVGGGIGLGSSGVGAWGRWGCESDGDKSGDGGHGWGVVGGFGQEGEAWQEGCGGEGYWLGCCWVGWEWVVGCGGDGNGG